MGDGFGVDPEEIRNHIANLNSGAFATIDTANTAAAGLSLGDSEAYGILLQAVIPPVLEWCLDDAGAAITSTANFAHAVGQALEGVAGDYEGVDGEIEGQLSKLAEELES